MSVCCNCAWKNKKFRFHFHKFVPCQLWILCILVEYGQIKNFIRSYSMDAVSRERKNCQK